MAPTSHDPAGERGPINNWFECGFYIFTSISQGQHWNQKKPESFTA